MRDVVRVLRLIVGLGLVLGLLVTPNAALTVTYHVNAVTGDDSRTCAESQNPGTPRKSIKKGLECAFLGEIVSVSSGTYAESVESKRDGAPGAPIVLRSAVVGGAVIRPTPGADEGVFVAHSHLTIDGFKVKGGTTGMKLGPHDGGGGPVVGLLIQNNTIANNTVEGIKVTNGVQTEIAFNTVFNNATNGISYSGNSSSIHDNDVRDNGQFGIYVKDGVDHDVYGNTVHDNGTSPDDDLKILGATVAQTFYVHCLTGDDLANAAEARNPATPWRTIKKALETADAGDTIVALGGTKAQPVVCNETTIESKRDGAPGKPIAIRANVPETVIIDPPAGNGIVVSHHHHLVSGLIVTGAVFGVQMGPHDGGDGPVNGLVLDNVRVHGNSVGGVKFTNAVKALLQHSVIRDNGGAGIFYSGTGARIMNNLVYANEGGGNYGITVTGGGGHKIRNNTIYGNPSGGLRLGIDASSVASGSASDNIIVGGSVGIKEQGTGSFTLEHNDVFGNGTDYDLVRSDIGPGSISAAPGFVNPAAGDFRLGRVATGQPGNSPCIDAGSASSDAMNLGGRTAFTDKFPDTGLVDLGYHGTVLFPTEGTVTITAASMTFSQGTGNDSFTLSATLAPGAGSDGIKPGANYTELSFGSLVHSLPVSGFQPLGGGRWAYSGASTSGTFAKQPNGTVTVSVQATGLNLALSDTPIPIGIRIGDDFGSLPVKLTGTLKVP